MGWGVGCGVGCGVGYTWDVEWGMWLNPTGAQIVSLNHNLP